MSLSEESRAELLRLQKLARQYEGIIRTSRNPDQLMRTKRDLKKIYDQIELASPGGLPDDLENPASKAPTQTIQDKARNTRVLKDFDINKCSVYCEDDDVNLLSSLLGIWEKEFATALSEGHVKLEFSLSQERDSHYSQLENSKRTLKTFTDILDDLSRATRDDVKMQMRDMRTRYMRSYLKDTHALVKKLYDFWNLVLGDIHAGGMRCMNKEDIIEFDRKLESATYLSKKPVKEAVEIAVQLLKESLELVNVPELNVR
ncbi:MAG: hypothetical protein KDK41_13320 [Leptospiraceae bacterium]|nr:hypothetical protein [Leptospiraceae bacterium]MCB1201620.1 hypothetical protein [Leptospiraceae bacterium]